LLAEDRAMRRWLIGYSAMSVGTVAVLLLVIWAVGGFTDMGISRDGMVALILAVSITVLLSLGLMGLVFYSGRSGHDETIMDGEDPPDGRAGGKPKHRPKKDDQGQ
jgi:hypothetical protein